MVGAGGYTAWDAECLKNDCWRLIPIIRGKGQELSQARCSRATYIMGRSRTTSKSFCCTQSSFVSCLMEKIGISPRAVRQGSRGLQPGHQRWCSAAKTFARSDKAGTEFPAHTGDTTPCMCLGFLLCP